MNRVTLLCLLSGSALVVTGAALIFHPLGYLVAGSCLIYASLIANSKRSSK
jgi:hypothetical protein